MLSDRVEVVWQRRRGIRRIHVFAFLGAVLIAGTVFALFNKMAVFGGKPKPEKQLIASIDLRVGNPAGAAERGDAKARADIEAGELKLQTVGRPMDEAEIVKAKKLYGVVWVLHSKDVTPLSVAYMDAYNKVMHAEIRLKYGDNVAERFIRLQTTMMRREG